MRARSVIHLWRTLCILAFAFLGAGILACANRENLLLPHEYRSPIHRFTFRYGEQWNLRTEVPEPGVEVMLVCADSLCGLGSNITFGVMYDAETAHLSQEQILSMANSQLLTRDIRNIPLVSSITIHDEGETQLGTQRAYQVWLTISFINNEERLRKMYLTFKDGYWYNVAVHADPDSFELAMTASQFILKSFRLQ